MDRIIKGSFSAVLQIHFSRIGHTVSGYPRLLAKTLGVAAIFMSFGLSAQSISPQMMEQAKNLPRAQQEALARQYGMDLDQILGVTAGNEEQEIAMPGAPLTQRAADDESNELNDYLMFQEKYAEFQESLIEEEEELKRFGISLFDREVSTFAPTDDATVPDNYRLGPGDNLVVQLFGKDNDQYDLQVSRDGTISFPKLGPITVAGLALKCSRSYSFESG